MATRKANKASTPSSLLPAQQTSEVKSNSSSINENDQIDNEDNEENKTFSHGNSQKLPK